MLNRVDSSGRAQRKATGSQMGAWFGSSLLSFLFLLFITGCQKDEGVLPQNAGDYSLETRGVMGVHEVTNLVADVDGYNAERIDPNLVNAWGIAIGPTGAFWISAAETELSVIYDDEGVELRPPVHMEGDPTGQVYNGTTGFVIPGEGAARFIFATEYGTVTAWRSGDKAMTMIDNSASGASYTGIELANDGVSNNIYLTDVANGRVIAYDQNWRQVASMSFKDGALPADAKPFNVRLMDGNLYVTYVMGKSGLVNVFNTKGILLRRFATGGPLAAPWGITKTPDKFGTGGGILVGNFGDGKINVYNKSGVLQSQLVDKSGQPIVIDGLWALTFTNGAFNGTSDPDLYFTAGPGDEEHGLFGEIELVQPVISNYPGGTVDSGK